MNAIARLHSPVFNFTPNADYETRISSSTVIFVAADAPFTGRSRAYFASSGLTNQFSPGYGIVNLNVGFVRERLKVGFYAKNLLDRKTIIQYPSVLSVPEGYTLRPLTSGITAAMQF